ncbi:MAG: F0F1 ATP synthase subunit gamma [Selenomonadaceae bacterium]|nr:F0F1 ATP synthase subunit gamma [Selenomonadaceae bacterium]MBR1806779.1 F0F1 ATP synthase subunit gamma [Selenomonadaceae bacterium]
MANLQHIRRRIKSVKNIQKITNAMDMIARSRFNAARDALLSNIPYVNKTKEIMRRVVSQMRGREYEHPFLKTRDELIAEQQNADGKFLFIVIASDKGLAGSFASNVFKEAHDTIEYDGTDTGTSMDDDGDDENFHKKNFDALNAVKPIAHRTQKQQRQMNATGGVARAAAHGGGSSSGANVSVAREYNDAAYIDGIEIITVGRKATTHFQQRGYNIIKSYHGISERPQYKYAKEIADLVMERYASGEIIDVTLIYTQFKSAISCVPDDVTLLPLVTDDYAKASANLKEEYIYEPDVMSILNEFLPRRLATRIYGAMLHSAASELSSRMNAMSNATDNAQELVGRLNLFYNKVRQAGITNEINEIVGGANALE